MTTNEELRRLADACLQPMGNLCEPHKWIIGSFQRNEEFRRAANPAKVKVMLDQIDTLVGALQMAKHIVHNHGSNEQMDEVFAALESVGVKP